MVPEVYCGWAGDNQPRQRREREREREQARDKGGEQAYRTAKGAEGVECVPGAKVW